MSGEVLFRIVADAVRSSLWLHIWVICRFFLVEVFHDFIEFDDVSFSFRRFDAGWRVYLTGWAGISLQCCRGCGSSCLRIINERRTKTRDPTQKLKLPIVRSIS
jgi:hypothetical protein